MPHVHQCAVCKQTVAVCDDSSCQQQEEQEDGGGRPYYCSAHHPDPEHRVEDKPMVRFTVAVAPTQES